MMISRDTTLAARKVESSTNALPPGLRALEEVDGRIVSGETTSRADEFYAALFRSESTETAGCDLVGAGREEIALPTTPIRVSLSLDRIRAASRLAHGWAIKTSALDAAARDALETMLTIKPPEKGGFGGLPGLTYPLFRVAGDELVVPRPFGVLHLGLTRAVDASALCAGPNCDPERMRFSPQCKLHEDYPPQVRATETVLRRWKLQGAAILSLPCGMGKTACAIWLSTEGTRRLWGAPGKTLVLVATEKLLHQWHKSYGVFAPTARVKLVQGKRLDYEDCDVCVAMVQTVMGHLDEEPRVKVKASARLGPSAAAVPRRKSLDPSAPNSWGFWSEFALVVVDEVHHVAAKQFSRVASSFNSKLLLGLSATPEGRADGNHAAVAWLTGQIAFRMRRDPSKDNLLIHMVHVDLDIFGFPVDSKLDKVWDFSKAHEAVAKCRARNAVLARILVRLARQGRMIFGLADRRLQICPEEGSPACVTSLVAHIDPAVGEMCALLVGQMPIPEQDAALEKPLVLATFPMAEEALDDPKRDTLVLLTFKTNRRCLEQSIGRIVRLHERKETVRPMLVDLVDSQESLAGRGHVRARIYEEVFGYKCEHHRWTDIQHKFPQVPAGRSDRQVGNSTGSATTPAPPVARPPKARRSKATPSKNPSTTVGSAGKPKRPPPSAKRMRKSSAPCAPDPFPNA